MCVSLVCFRVAVLVFARHRADQKRETGGGVIPGFAQGHHAHQDGGDARGHGLRSR